MVGLSSAELSWPLLPTERARNKAKPNIKRDVRIRQVMLALLAKSNCMSRTPSWVVSFLN
jgi:hypothetical protein